ncbi:hypothetical protein ACLKA6_013029 [Drosophila palustris]
MPKDLSVCHIKRCLALDKNQEEEDEDESQTSSWFTSTGDSRKTNKQAKGPTGQQSNECTAHGRRATKVASGHDHCLHLGRAAVWLTNNGHANGNWPARRPFRVVSSRVESSRVVVSLSPRATHSFSFLGFWPLPVWAATSTLCYQGCRAAQVL